MCTRMSVGISVLYCMTNLHKQLDQFVNVFLLSSHTSLLQEKLTFFIFYFSGHTWIQWNIFCA